MNLENNNLFTLAPLVTLHHMTHLNASHNKITELIDFKPSKCIENIDLSYNLITKMKDLQDLPLLKELNLNNN